MVEGVYGITGHVGAEPTGPVGPDSQNPPVGLQGYAGVQGAPPGYVYGPSVTNINIANIEKMSLKTGDILIVHYPIGMPQRDVHALLQSLKRINDRLKEKGISLADVVLFNEGVKISVLSPTTDTDEKPSDYRRIELSE